MKITVTRGELKDAIQGFAKIIAGKPTLSILGCVRFAVEAGDLTAQATDLDQTLVYRFDNAEAEGEGVVIVPFQLLRDLSKGAGAVNVTFENAGGNAVKVITNVGGHAVASTSEGADPQDWPAAGAEIKTSEAKGFLSAYRRMAPFASTDATRRTLQCVYADVAGEGEHNATLVACDGHRLTCCNSMRLPIDDEHGVMIPVSKFLLWNGLAGEADIGMSKTKECTRFCVRSGHWTYRVKAVDGVYPNWRQVVPGGDGMEHRLVFTDPDVEALRKILPGFPGADAVCLEGAKNGTLSISGRDRDAVRELTVPLTAGSSYKGVGCRFIANRAYLLDALNAGFRNFMFADGASPLVSDDGNGATHVLMPLRLEGPVKPAPQPEPADTKAAQAQTSAQSPAAALKPQPQQQQEKTEMTKEIKPAPRQAAAEPTALEKLQAAFDNAKAKVRDAQSALADVASAIRDAVKEDRTRRAEVENVRAGLAKLQTIKV